MWSWWTRRHADGRLWWRDIDVIRRGRRVNRHKLFGEIKKSCDLWKLYFVARKVEETSHVKRRVNGGGGGGGVINLMFMFIMDGGGGGGPRPSSRMFINLGSYWELTNTLSLYDVWCRLKRQRHSRRFVDGVTKSGRLGHYNHWSVQKKKPSRQHRPVCGFEIWIKWFIDLFTKTVFSQ